MVYQFTNLQADSGDAMINLYQWEHPMGKFLLQKQLSKKNETKTIDLYINKDKLRI